MVGFPFSLVGILIILTDQRIPVLAFLLDVVCVPLKMRRISIFKVYFLPEFQRKLQSCLWGSEAGTDIIRVFCYLGSEKVQWFYLVPSGHCWIPDHTQTSLKLISGNSRGNSLFQQLAAFSIHAIWPQFFLLRTYSATIPCLWTSYAGFKKPRMSLNSLTSSLVKASSKICKLVNDL